MLSLFASYLMLNDAKVLIYFHPDKNFLWQVWLWMVTGACHGKIRVRPNDASTTTWVFIAKNENYEACVNLMFDYFTDYTISAKRSSLRDADTNPPEMFKAEDYTFINHNELGQ